MEKQEEKLRPTEWTPSIEKVEIDGNELLDNYRELQGQAVRLSKAVDSIPTISDFILFGGLSVFSGAATLGSAYALVKIVKEMPIIANNFDNAISRVSVFAGGTVAGLAAIGVGIVGGYIFYELGLAQIRSIQSLGDDKRILHEENNKMKQLYNSDVKKLVLKK